jgi:protein-tyrosine phosphatase
MIDLHCHILPGLDDGPGTMSEAVKMAKVAVNDGITTLVATPHIDTASQSLSDGFSFGEKMHKALTELRHQCTVLDIPLRLIAGGEVTSGMGMDDIRPFAINGKNYVLVEFPHAFLPGNAAETIFNCVATGFTPIIAHPERNTSVLERPDRLGNLIRAGALLQITGGSLLGHFGSQCKACAHYLLKKGLVSFLASDAHSCSNRRPVLSAAVGAAARFIGAEAAQDLVWANPRAVISGRPLAASDLKTSFRTPSRWWGKAI